MSLESVASAIARIMDSEELFLSRWGRWFRASDVRMGLCLP